MTEHKQQKFRNKVLLIFIVLALPPLLLLAGSNLYLVVRTRQENIAELQRTAINNVNDRLIKMLIEKQEGLNLVISGEVGSLKEVPLANASFLLDNTFSVSKPNRMDFIDGNGNLIARKTGSGIFYGTGYLKFISQRYPTIYTDQYQRYFVEKNAREISDVEVDYGENADFTTAKSGTPFYGQPLKPDPKVDEYLMQLAGPIKDQNNKTIGVISAEFNAKDLNAEIGKIKVGEKGYIYIVDKSGKVIATNNDVVPYWSDMGGSRPVANLIRTGNAAGFQTRKNSSGEYAAFLGLKVKSGDKDIDSQLDWYIVSEWPVGDAYSVIRNILAWSLLIAIFTAAFIIILSLYFTRQIVKPINELTRGAREISEGNLDHKIHLATNDEFEVLGGKFNDMIAVIKDNQKLRDEFVFIAAHELRTPVTAIKGYLSMILEGSFGAVPEQAMGSLKIVNQANERLVQLVHDLLEVARNDAGKMKIEMREILINDEVNTVLSELKPLAAQKGIPLEYDEGIPLKCMADTYKIKEVLINLIGNAVKYTTGTGGVKIWHEERQGEVITHIQDHGIGMTPEEVSKLFGKFFRAQNEETAKIEGTGLGLFIVKEIVTRMSGDIWVESEKGKGSIFSFKLKTLG